MTNADAFVFDGVSSLSFGLSVYGKTPLTDPVPDMTDVVIPGRNGVLHQYNNRFADARISYTCIAIQEQYRENIEPLLAGIRGFLLGHQGYYRLEDTFRPDEYRMAVYKGGASPVSHPHDEAGGVVINFSARPERWLRSGEQAVQGYNGGVIMNPTYFPAKPLIRLYGTGTLTITNSAGSVALKVTTANQYTDIDCEAQEAYKGATNCNNNVTLVNGKFPRLEPGENRLSVSGFSQVQITPRWYIL